MGPPGHFAIGLAAKPLAPKLPLWLLLAATELFDVLFFVFQALGLEKAAVSTSTMEQGVVITSLGSIPWSHGLFMCVVWSAAAGVIAYLVYRDRRTSVILGLVMFSHWVLDFVVHLPDLPLFFDNSPLLGLGLWGSGLGYILSWVLEIVLLAGGIAVYAAYRKRN